MKKTDHRFTRIHLNTCASTQDFLRKHMDRFIPDLPVCVTADAQTRGHGREERSWYSAPGLGLYLSWGFSLRRRHMLHWVPLVAGLAVTEVLEKNIKAPVQMKWPNDILVSGRKVSGVLSESRIFSEQILCCCGVGINLNHSAGDFPEELRKKAASLAMVTQKKHYSADRLLVQLCARLTRWLQTLESGSSEKILAAVNLRMRWMYGSRISIRREKSEILGQVLGISSDGGLILMLPEGTRDTFFSGEIQRIESPSS